MATASTRHDFPLVIAVGASAGGVEALSELVSALPAGLAAPVLVVLHVAPAGHSVLPAILARRTGLEVAEITDWTTLHAGRLYVAPPDRHLIVEDGGARLTREPRENGHRPAIDPLFRSVASAYGRRSVGVVLSGTRDDGARGLARIAAAGGHALVQDPGHCLYDQMPRNALTAVREAESLGVPALADRLTELTRSAVPASENDLAEPADPSAREPETGRLATRFTCPDCGGVLFEDHEGDATAYACSVGHAYSPDSLEQEQARQLESALWAAVRSLEDRCVLLRRMAEHAGTQGRRLARESFEAQAADVAERATLIRRIVAPPSAGSAAA